MVWIISGLLKLVLVDLEAKTWSEGTLALEPLKTDLVRLPGPLKFADGSTFFNPLVTFT